MIASMRRVVLGAAVGSMIVMTIAAPSTALADPPHLTIESPHPGSLTNDPTPKFRGTTDDTVDVLDEELFDQVTLKVWNDAFMQELVVSSKLFSEDWSAVAGPLADGTYTAQATQTSAVTEETGRSEPVTFTVDATPPVVTMTTPGNGTTSNGPSQALGGSAGTAGGDRPAIMIQLFSGEANDPQALLQTLVAQASEASWSAALGGLGPGTYTAQATQRDQAGNTGASSPVTFTIAAPSVLPPVASFQWFPPKPTTGETVSLVSSSTDPASSITGFEWSLSRIGAFSAGKPVLTTSFATPGGHVVRLRVTDAAGRSSIAAQTVPVTARRSVLMQPFPIVRIAGSVTSRGARLRRLTVQAPIGTRVTVACRGPGCKTKSESRLATVSSKSKGRRTAGVVQLAFHRFERPLRAGAILTVLVSKSGEIGTYTSFLIRRHKPPVRKDACIASARSKPTPCPTS